MRTETYGRWWLNEKYLADGDPGTTHDTESCDHRHFVVELDPGWMFWTPAGRLETVERMEPTDRSEWQWRIWTKETGPDWSWRRQATDRVHAIAPTPVYGPHLRLVDLPRAARGASMHIVPAAGLQLVPDFSLTLVRAQYLGAGLGWTMADRPDGGDEVTTAYTTKAKTRAAMLGAGRHHAKILKLKLYKEEDIARHF